MANPIFPTLAKGQDSKHYGVELEDPAMRTQMEGGYVVSRAKHTRRPRRTFKTGFTGIGAADYATLQNFWDTVRGGSVIFDWTDPITNVVWQVRFAEKLVFKYAGIGNTRLWDVMASFEQA